MENRRFSDRNDKSRLQEDVNRGILHRIYVAAPNDSLDFREEDEGSKALTSITSAAILEVLKEVGVIRDDRGKYTKQVEGFGNEWDFRGMENPIWEKECQKHFNKPEFTKPIENNMDLGDFFAAILNLAKEESSFQDDLSHFERHIDTLKYVIPDVIRRMRFSSSTKRERIEQTLQSVLCNYLEDRDYEGKSSSDLATYWANRLTLGLLTVHKDLLDRMTGGAK